ncbi:MAG TPA: hypothetical protein ENO00_04765, partial [Deltaproteobacteria bacterium]|nr:hypothetical protein [Deltaproteobacteria bacterium]
MGKEKTMTSQENEKRQYRPEDHYREDEISLIDLLRVIWKWKWLIIAGVVICVVAAAVISSRMQRIYEVSMAIEPGIAGVGQSGNFLTIDSPDNISGKIEGGVYNKKLQEYFHLNLQKHKLEFKSNPIKEASLIKITSRWEERDVSIGMKISGQLLEFLGDDYSKVIKQMMDNYEQQIKINMDRIENFQNELQLHQAMYMNIQQRKKRIVEEIR